MAAVFHTRTIAADNKNVIAKWYEVSPGEMTISTTSTGLSYYGTNASFFWEGENVMTAMHVVNGQPVFSGGLNNYASGGANTTATRMSALYCQLLVAGGNVGYAFGLTPLAETYSDVPQPSNGSVIWAIGGINLLVNENRTSLNDLMSRYRTYYSDLMVDGDWIPAHNIGNARTFIGYNPVTNKILFGVLSSSINGTTIANSTVTYYDMHLVLKNGLQCSMALSLDGGRSTKVKYGPDASPTLAQTNPSNNYVRCQLRMTASTCTWNGI